MRCHPVLFFFSAWQALFELALARTTPLLPPFKFSVALFDFADVSGFPASTNAYDALRTFCGAGVTLSAT